MRAGETVHRGQSATIDDDDQIKLSVYSIVTCKALSSSTIYCPFHPSDSPCIGNCIKTPAHINQ